MVWTRTSDGSSWCCERSAVESFRFRVITSSCCARACVSSSSSSAAACFYPHYYCYSSADGGSGTAGMHGNARLLLPTSARASSSFVGRGSMERADVVIVSPGGRADKHRYRSTSCRRVREEPSRIDDSATTEQCVGVRSQKRGICRRQARMPCWPQRGRRPLRRPPSPSPPRPFGPILRRLRRHRPGMRVGRGMTRLDNQNPHQKKTRGDEERALPVRPQAALGSCEDQMVEMR